MLGRRLPFRSNLLGIHSLGVKEVNWQRIGASWIECTALSFAAAVAFRHACMLALVLLGEQSRWSEELKNRLYRRRRTVLESLATRAESSLHTDVFLRIFPTTNELGTLAWIKRLQRSLEEERTGSWRKSEEKEGYNFVRRWGERRGEGDWGRDVKLLVELGADSAATASSSLQEEESNMVNGSRWMVRRRILILVLSIVILSLFSSALVAKFGSPLRCEFFSLCNKNFPSLSSIPPLLRVLPNKDHHHLAGPEEEEELPPPPPELAPADDLPQSVVLLDPPLQYYTSDDELTAHVLAQDILSRPTLSLSVEQAKVAFMFMTPGALPFEAIWEKFFEVREWVPPQSRRKNWFQTREHCPLECGCYSVALSLCTIWICSQFSALYAGTWRQVLCLCPCIWESLIGEYLEEQGVQRARDSIWEGMHAGILLLLSPKFSSCLQNASTTSWGNIQLCTDYQTESKGKFCEFTGRSSHVPRFWGRLNSFYLSLSLSLSLSLLWVADMGCNNDMFPQSIWRV